MHSLGGKNATPASLASCAHKPQESPACKSTVLMYNNNIFLGEWGGRQLNDILDQGGGRQLNDILDHGYNYSQIELRAIHKLIC